MTTGLGLRFCQPACRQANAQDAVIFIGKEDNGNVVGIGEGMNRLTSFTILQKKNKK